MLVELDESRRERTQWKTFFGLIAWLGLASVPPGVIVLIVRPSCASAFVRAAAAAAVAAVATALSVAALFRCESRATHRGDQELSRIWRLTAYTICCLGGAFWVVAFVVAMSLLFSFSEACRGTSRIVFEAGMWWIIVSLGSVLLFGLWNCFARTVLSHSLRRVGADEPGLVSVAPSPAGSAAMREIDFAAKP